MADVSISDWGFWITGGLLLLLGATGAARALWGDRARGRKRCPKCWYSMEGAVISSTPGVVAVCPECGRSIRHEGQLFANRRRWKVCGLCVVLGLAGAASVCWPVVRSGDWEGLVPSSILVFVTESERYPSPRPTLGGELARRIRDRALNGWQMQVALDRYFAANPADLHDEIRTRERWPSGTPVRVTAFSPSIMLDAQYNSPDVRVRMVRAGLKPDDGWQNRNWDHGFLVNVGIPPEGTDPFELEVECSENGRRLWHGRVRCPTEVGGSINDLLTPVQSPELDDAVRRWLKPHLDIKGPRHVLLALEELGREAALGEYLALGLRCEVLCDRRVVARGTYVGCPEIQGGRCGNAPTCTWVVLDWAEGYPREAKPGEQWSIRVSGDAELALGDFDIFVLRRARPDPTRYWAGEIVVDVPELKLSLR